MPDDFLESDLEKIIYDNRRVITNYGLPQFKSVAFRQVYLPSGRKVDILGFEVVDGVLFMDIYELKRDCIDAAAVCQAYNYLEEVRQLIGNSFIKTNITVLLIGRRTSMTSHIERTCLPIQVWSYDYTLTGVKFSKLNSSTLRHQESEHFTMGIAAFGMKKLYFNEDPDKICIDAEYKECSISHPSTHAQIADLIKRWSHGIKIVKEVQTQIIEVPVQPKGVETIHFPENPSWSKEFEKELWEVDLPPLEDIFPYENEDLEPEPLENDAEEEDPGFDEETLQPEWIDKRKIEEMEQSFFESLNLKFYDKEKTNEAKPSDNPL